jgi:ubiquinone/menaquinone biosynthesis C-methylase UbiE
MPEPKLTPMSDTAFRVMAWMMGVMDFFSPSAVRRHLSKVPLKEGMTVVDYACGPGRYTIPIAEIVGPKGKVFAVDIQPVAIETVKRKAARKRLSNIEAVLVDSFDTGIPGGAADVVLLVDMIHMVSDRGSLVREAHRLLKPDGVLFVGVEHINAGEVRTQLEATGLFNTVKFEGRDVLLSKI